MILESGGLGHLAEARTTKSLAAAAGAMEGSCEGRQQGKENPHCSLALTPSTSQQCFPATKPRASLWKPSPQGQSLQPRAERRGPDLRTNKPRISTTQPPGPGHCPSPRLSPVWPPSIPSRHPAFCLGFSLGLCTVLVPSAWAFVLYCPFLPSTSQLTSHYHPEAQEIVQHLGTAALSISSINPFKIFFRDFGTM